MDELFTNDILAILPKSSQEKVIQLAELRADAHSVVKGAEAALDAAEQRRDRADLTYRTQVERITYSPSGQSRALSPEESASLRAPLDRVEAEIDRLKARRDRAADNWRAFDFLTEVRAFLGDAKMAGRRFRSAPPTKVPTGDFHRAVESSRRHLDEIEIEAERVELAPLPVAELRTAVEAEIDSLAGKGALFLDPRIRSGSPLKLEAAFGLSGQGDRVAALASSLVFLLRDQIKTSALALLPAKELPGALTDAARKAELARLTAERLEIERAEEAAIVAAAAAGIVIPRRRAASPLAILEISEA